jgi:protein-S-isoprenylcysteine O-methyltransferase Ste14
MSNQSEKVHMSLINRTKKDSNPLPRLLFSFLRAADPYLQYLLMFHGYGHQIIAKTGIATVPVGPKGTVLIAMAAGCAVKQIINMIYIIETEMTYAPIVIISIYNTVMNSLATFSSLIYGPSNELGILQYIGISLFTVGISTELISELQRKRFKDNPANKGKLYTGGLFSLARHINYGGYTLWRTGLALTSGNYWLAALQFVWHMWDFTKRGVPELADYCSKKYGDDWKKFEHDVPNILLPYVW